MTLVAGDRLGPYEVVGKLGAGGMGEVYRARDPRLDRDVAVKVLPAAFVADPERLARFEREAKVLAQLNHPNIAAIHGLEESDGVRALVMELVEGPTLAERLERGALPVDDAVAIARQIAEALEEAHERGIVHRDLKPQNVKAPPDGKVKVLDFGLAKALDPAVGPGSASQLAHSPTLTLGATVQGVILGTAAYMAPEQAKGLAVDKRADIWAFGVVLYEMLTGGRLFAGDSVPETLAGVLKSEIDLEALPPATPPAVRRLLARCLERSPRRRLRDIGEAVIALEDGAGEESDTVAARARRWPLAAERAALLLAGGVLALAIGALTADEPQPTAAAVTRLHLVPPDGEEMFDPVPSPDGRRIVFARVRGSGRQSIAVRSLDDFAVVDLPGTEDGYEPIWSPDGRSIAFFGAHLAVVGANGIDRPRPLAPVVDGRGASWSRDGVLLYAPAPAGPLWAVAADGGEPRPVTDVDAERGELAHVRPDLLPDGRRFLYLIRGDRPEHTGIYAGSLGGDLKRKVLALQVPVRYAEPGYLLSVEGTTLVARRFDPDALEVTGEPRVVAGDVEYQARWDWPAFRVSASGLLAYNPLVASPEREILRVDRGGKRLASISAAGDSNLDLAPDGSRLAVIRPDAERRRPYLWIHDLVRGVSSPFAPENAGNGPVWSPDGRQLAYVSFRSPAQTICVRPAAGGVERTLWSDSSIVEPVDWSPDGRWLLVETGKPGEGGNLMLVPVEGGGEPQPFLATSAGEHSGRFSPDGSLVAYTSDASGRDEVYLEPLARTGERWQVSSDGGAAPRWSADGAELFYVRPGTRELDSTLVAVTVERTADEPRLGVSRPLGPIGSQDYEPVAGGGEFIVAVAVGQTEAAPPVLITNWPALLDERRPGP